MKYVLLNSGGTDSRVVAALLKRDGHEVHSFHVNAVPHLKEIQGNSSAKTSELCDSHFVFDFPYDWAVKKDMGHTSVPFTGNLLTTLGAMYASFIGAERVATGLRIQGTNPKRLEQLNELFSKSLATKPITFEAPLWTKTFFQVVDLAKELGVDLSDTHSCPESPACGKCRVCLIRKRVGL